MRMPNGSLKLHAPSLEAEGADVFLVQEAWVRAAKAELDALQKVTDESTFKRGVAEVIGCLAHACRSHLLPRKPMLKDESQRIVDAFLKRTCGG